MSTDYSFIKKYRKLAGLTQRELGEKVNVSAAYIQQLENGVKNNPSLRLLYMLIDVLRVPDGANILDKETAWATSITDELLNGVLFNNIDFKKNNYIGSISDNPNYLITLAKLLEDVVKVIMYVEDIPEENISNRDFDELQFLIIDYLKIKNNICNMDRPGWEKAFDKKSLEVKGL